MPPLAAEQSKNMILSIFMDMTENGNLPAYLEHVGFDIGALSKAADLPKAILGHYRIKQGEYDTDRATNHMATWPPIASRIVELQIERSMIGHNSANTGL